jgi:hypothetical protein
LVFHKKRPPIERKTGKLTRSLPFLHRTDPCRLLLESSDSLLELIHTSAGVNKLLLAGEERMALGANFNLDLAALGGLGLYSFAACASDDAGLVIRMDSVFHWFVPLFLILMFFDIIPPLGRHTDILYHNILQIARAFLHFLSVF